MYLKKVIIAAFACYHGHHVIYCGISSNFDVQPSERATATLGRPQITKNVITPILGKWTTAKCHTKKTETHLRDFSDWNPQRYFIPELEESLKMLTSIVPLSVRPRSIVQQASMEYEIHTPLGSHITIPNIHGFKACMSNRTSINRDETYKSLSM